MLRPRGLPLPFPGDSAGRLVEGSCPGPASPRGSPKTGALQGVVRREATKQETWDVLPGRVTATGAHLSEQVLVWPPGWAELGTLWWNEPAAKVLGIEVSLEPSGDTLF